MPDELISIIVPVYNSQYYLEGCLNSLRNQTYSTIEIILVNDGSTDGSREVCHRHMAEDSRIRYFEQENGGPASARNFGIQQISGDYLTFVDADDWVEATYVEDLYTKLVAYDADISLATHTKFSQEKDTFFVHVFESDYYERLYARQEFLEALPVLESMDNAFYTSWGILFKSSLFSQISFPQHRFAEDVGTNYKLFLKAERIVYLHKPLYIYRGHEDSLNHERSSQVASDMIGALLKRMATVAGYGYSVDNKYRDQLLGQLDWLKGMLAEGDEGLRQEMTELGFLWR